MIVVPNISNSQSGIKLISTARNIEYLARYARNMSILRENQLMMVFDNNRKIIYVGEELKKINDSQSQEVLIRLGYTQENTDETTISNIEQEIKKNIPNGLIFDSFEINDESMMDDNYYIINFFPDGQCDEFKLILRDNSNKQMEISGDPISSKVLSKFVQ